MPLFGQICEPGNGDTVAGAVQVFAKTNVVTGSIFIQLVDYGDGVKVLNNQQFYMPIDLQGVAATSLLIPPGAGVNYYIQVMELGAQYPLHQIQVTSSA